ncbi:MAG TPA: hypothetical protein VM689_10225 [Aliidongia sp.]|nr:hypothetical protein [Aliidongia sp.]
MSALLMAISLLATATAATMESQDITTGPVGLLTVALLCIVLMLLVWSDDLDRHSVRRARARARVARGA